MYDFPCTDSAKLHSVPTKLRKEKEKEEENNDAKKEAFQNLINNVDTIEPGKYEWNGTSFVKVN